MGLSRRQSLRTLGTVGLASVSLLLAGEAIAAPRHRRRRRRRRRRVVRRRTRRRVRRVMRSGRWLLQVPAATVVGWELVIEDRVMLVTETKVSDDNEHLVLEPLDGGKAQTMPVIREDTPENGEEHQGSEIED